MQDQPDRSSVGEVEAEIANILKGPTYASKANQDLHDQAGASVGGAGISGGQVDRVHSPSIPPGPQDNQPTPAPDPINPQYYKSHPSGIECIEICRHLNFNVGNAIKYLWRYLDKGDPVENIRKAQWYLNDEINRLQKVYKK